MKNLLAFLLFGILVILQSTIVSRMPLLNGTADLILVFVLAWALQDRVDNFWLWTLIGGSFANLYSALPFGTYILAYLIATGIARLIKRRVWKAPFLVMLTATFVGTLIVQGVSIIARFVTGVRMPFLTTLNLVILPGLLLNVLLAMPIFFIMHDMANWFYPEELEV